MARFTELLILKVTVEMAREIRRRAQQDERSVSAVARRLISAGLADNQRENNARRER